MVQKLHKQIIEIESASDLSSLRPSRPFVWVRETATLYRFDPGTDLFTQYPATASPAKVYRALVSQSGANDPSAIVLENSLGGDVVWTRTQAGFYLGTLAGAFPAVNKLFTRPDNNYGYFYGPDGPNIQLTRMSIDAVGITIGSSEDGYLSKTPIEILVYP